MPRISEADKTAVRGLARIEDIIGEYTELRKAGSDRMMGVCPFPEHDDHSPSFSVTLSTGLYYCHGCGEGGDVFKFLQVMQAASFPEAVEMVAERVNFTLTVDENAPVEKPSFRKIIMEINAEAEAFFAQQLLDGDDASGRDFIRQRGYDAAASSERFGVGYAPRRGNLLLRHLTAKGYKVADIEKAGLVAKSRDRNDHYDFFRGRPTWAIRDAGGKVLGFGARKISDQDTNPGKFINTTETDAYKKNRVLFGIDIAKSTISQTKQAIVVEGYMDVMAMHLSGVTNAVAACGTAFTEEHIALLARLVGVGGEIVFMFDGDDAGQKAADRAYKTTLGCGVKRLTVVVIGNGQDPDQLLHTPVEQGGGPSGVASLLTQRVPLVEMTLRRQISAAPRETFEDRCVARDAATPVLLELSDIAIRAHYAELVSELLDLPYADVAGPAKLSPKGRERERQAKADAAADTRGAVPVQIAAADERAAIQLMLRAPRILDTVPYLVDVDNYMLPIAVRLLIPIARWRGLGGIHALREMLDETALAAVDQVLAEPFTIADEQLRDYGLALNSRLLLAATNRTIARMEAALDSADVTIEALDELDKIKRHRELLKAQSA